MKYISQLVQVVMPRDDATETEKKSLIEETRNAPLTSPTHALFHPSELARVHKNTNRYQAKTWGFPRVTGCVIWAMYGFMTADYIWEVKPDGVAILFGSVLGITMAALASSIFVSIIRFPETCVWCHIIQRDKCGTVVATLSLVAYRLPFLDPARSNPSPWQRTRWNTTPKDVMLEANKNILRLSIADIYDETVCSVRLPVPIPPEAQRYAVRKIESHGDIALKKQRTLGDWFGQVVRPTIPVVAAAVLAAAATIRLFI